MREFVATFLDAGLLVLAVLAFLLPALSALALVLSAAGLFWIRTTRGRQP